MPEIKKYLNSDGLEEYNSLLPHSSGEMQDYVGDWLDAHPEATTTVQDGAISEPKLADKSVSLRTLANDTVHMLKGMMLTREISGEVLTADDAYSAPPVALTVEGKSTQDGTPTPDAPVEIVSLEQANIHFGDINVLLNLTQALRSLPDGTHDTLSFAYLRPSTREGWAWYSREVVQAVAEVEINSFSSVGTNNTRQCVAMVNIGSRYFNVYNVAGETLLGASNRFTTQQTSGNYVTNGHFVYYSGNGFISFGFANGRFANVTEANAWLAENPTYVHLKLRTPTTKTLDPIELPVLPAPTCTVWSDPSTGLRMRYVRDSNLVIQRIEEAIADQ